MTDSDEAAGDTIQVDPEPTPRPSSREKAPAPRRRETSFLDVIHSEVSSKNTSRHLNETVESVFAESSVLDQNLFRKKIKKAFLKELELSKEGSKKLDSLEIDDDSDNEDDSLLEPNCPDESERMCRSNKSIMSYVTSSSNAAEEVADHHDSIPTTSCSGRRLKTEEHTQQLADMFPDMQRHALKETFKTSNYDIHTAVSTILNAGKEPDVQHIAEKQNEVGNSEVDTDDSDDVEILMNAPLSSGAIFNSSENALENLQRFVKAVVPQFGEDLDVHTHRHKPGLDGGGLTQEYFHLLMKMLQRRDGSLILFEGLNGHLVPIHNYDIFSGGLFVLLRKIILHAVLNSCSGMPGLSPAVVAYLLTGNRDACVEHVKLADIPDPVLQDKLDKIVFIF
ncbi:G2 M phase-specific E3 ubiquitin- ligase [Paramuricea clavata]|uniref:G2 M phase-specific E3 ubiquitin- ligase n=1 Tax=Paramuricea clavata TaxID=317549 RepID=A0A6S7GN40_PARCT|nr:G2 M phase-specific E3 ubiquitin- ligase [Paramuricea clavata]